MFCFSTPNSTCVFDFSSSESLTDDSLTPHQETAFKEWQHATPHHATPLHTAPHRATPRHATPRYATPRYAMPRYAILRHADTVARNNFIVIRCLVASGVRRNAMYAFVAAFKIVQFHGGERFRNVTISK